MSLMREHAQLEEAFKMLLAAFKADARIEFAQLWSEFDARLRAHMLLEERSLLPAFSREHPREAARILAEHAQIEKTLTELGIDVDLHLARTDLVDEFVALLRAHSAYEEELYAWAEVQLGRAEHGNVLERLLSRLKHMPAARSVAGSADAG